MDNRTQRIQTQGTKNLVNPMRDQAKVSELGGFLKGDVAALDLAIMLIDVADVWDDLIDKDAQVSGDNISRVMVHCLSGIPRNPFYRSHVDELMPVIETSICNWLASNALCSSGERKSLEVANVIRHDVANVFIHMARIIGGLNWAIQVTPSIRLWAQHDTLEQFLKG